MDQPDPAADGVDLFQTTPDTVQFETGFEQMRILRLGPKGPLRWYASCCNAPMFNTLARPGVPFVTANTARLADVSALGPVLTHIFIPQPGGSTKHKGAALMVWRLLSRLGAARLSGRWRQTPFFDLATGEPTAAIRVLTKEERAALRKA